MNRYFLNKKSIFNGNYSVHKEDCPFLPEAEKRIYLGTYESCYDALRIAKMISSKSDGCYFCSKVCSHLGREVLSTWDNKILN